jgi:hypothetical protein
VISRRAFVSMLPAACCLPRAVRAAEPGAAEETLAPDLDRRIERGLAYLVRQQQPDGSFLNREGGDEKNPKFGGPKVALSALSLAAFLAAGRAPDAGRYGAQARKAIDYLVKAAPADDGYYGKLDGTHVAGHAAATFALAESYGTEPADAGRRKRHRDAVDRAVRVLLAAQALKKDEPHRGGWGADRSSGDSDLPVTAWCVLALRAALNAGVDVPRESADRAAEYVLRCWRAEKGCFLSRANGGNDDPAAVAATAAGALALQLLDRGRRPDVVAAAVKYVAEHPAGSDAEYAYFARFAGALAAFQFGGQPWAATWDVAQQKLGRYQDANQDGSFTPSKTAREPGPTYSTATAILTLAIPLRLLPAYQR